MSRERSAAGLASVRRILVPLAGPALIVAAALIVLRRIAFQGLLGRADELTFFLPTYCFLGRSLAAGHIPAWDPYVMGGHPFAADPQSGWTYLPAMALFSALPCDLAIRAMVVLQPVLAGLGLLAFLRSEGLSRPAATAGGVVLSTAVASSALAGSLPFAGTVAWTALLLAAASRLVHAGTWPGRLRWLLLTAVAWGQLAGASFTDGVLLGTGALGAYLAAHMWSERREEGSRFGRSLVLLGLLAASMATVNLAVLLPRLEYLPATSLHLGYAGLEDLRAQLAGLRPPPLPVGASTGPRWPLDMATSPGLHVGAIALALAFGGLWSRRRRHLWVAFAVFGLTGYALALRPVADAIAPLMRRFRLGSFYVHSPQRFSLAAVMAVAAMAGLGVEAWRDHARTRDRVVMLLPGLIVWAVLPLAMGVDPRRLWLLGAGLAAGGIVLAASVRRPALLALVPVLLASEMATNAILEAGRMGPFQTEPAVLGPAQVASVDLAPYIRPGPIAGTLASGGGRYVSVGSPLGQEAAQAEGGDGLFDQAMLFRIRNAGGYNPVQLLRYWTFTRSVGQERIQYNRATFDDPPPIVLDLLQVDWVLAEPGGPVPQGAHAVARHGTLALYRLGASFPRAQVVASWSLLAGPDQARAAVLQAGFDPSRQAVLERTSATPPPPGPAGPGRLAGLARYRQMGGQAAVISIDAPVASVVIIRDAYASHWHARVDGRRVPVFPADYFLQGVPVPAGTHTVTLAYDDPWLGYGSLGSGLAVLALLGGAAILRRRGAVVPPALVVSSGGAASTRASA